MAVFFGSAKAINMADCSGRRGKFLVFFRCELAEVLQRYQQPHKKLNAKENGSRRVSMNGEK